MQQAYSTAPADKAVFMWSNWVNKYMDTHGILFMWIAMQLIWSSVSVLL